MTRNIAGILLAAGQSRRFGRQKLLQPLENGTAIVAQSGNNLLHVLPDSIAIVQEQASQIASLLTNKGFRCVCNPNTLDGISSSIKAGIQHQADMAGWVIALGDMPFISTHVIRAVANAIADGALIAAPRYNGQRGQPVGFSVKMKPQLLELVGDQGGKSILETYADKVRLVDVDDPGILRDIDRVEDLVS